MKNYKVTSNRNIYRETNKTKKKYIKIYNNSKFLIYIYIYIYTNMWKYKEYI